MRAEVQRGANIEMPLRIGFMESVTGCSKTFTVQADVNCETCGGSGNKVGTTPVTCKRCKGSGHITQTQMIFQVQAPCPSCDGQGKKGSPCPPCRGTGLTRGSREVTIKVPAGSKTGDKLRVREHGHAGPQGTPKGHLFVHLQVDTDPVFTRDGNHVHVNVPISLSTAVLGGKVTVPSLNGEVILKVSPGTQPEEKVVMRGKGIQAASGDTGHQYIHFKVEIPKHLTPQQQKLMEEFAATDPSYQKKT
jgi:molecular chaperone DnaJ